MDSSTPAKPSKTELFGRFIQRGFKRAPDAIPSISRPSSPRPAEISSDTNNSPRFPGSVVSPYPKQNLSLDISLLPGLVKSPDDSALPIVATPAVPSAIPSEVPSTNAFKDASGVAWNGLKTVLQVLDKTSDVFPPLKSVVGGLLACVDIVEATSGNREDYEELSAELATMAANLERVSKLTIQDRDGSIACILQMIKAEATHISQQQAHGKGRRIVESFQDKEDVLKRFRRIESLFRQLQNNINLQTWDTTRKTHEVLLLQGMSSVDAARYNSSYSTTIKRRACTETTREKIQQDMEEWVVDPNGTKLYWMNGMAGTGKTTILYSLCKWLEKNRRLGGNFFCSRILDSCRDANNILPTLAYQLARYSSAFRRSLCEVLDEDPDAGKRDINHQFEKLILEPMKEVKDSMPEGVVVIIDALDECDDSSVVGLFLGIVIKHAENLPIKFIVTSRPEPVIRDQMLAPGFSRSVLHLHDIEQSLVEADIKTYLTEELHAMKTPPSSDQVEQLAKRAGTLFIYAATAVRYIDPGNSRVNSGLRLETVLKVVPSEKSKQYKELDKLYAEILSAAFSEDLEDEETNGIRLVLWTTICAKEPLSVQTLALLLGLAEMAVQASLEPLRSVLHVQERGGIVSALHASFPDYMFDRGRSGETFYCDRTQHSRVLANGCFDVMKAQLRFNICDLESSFIFDKEIADLDERIQTFISRGLSYACRYWGEHLRDGNFTDGVHKELVDFVTSRLLFWMEVLNLEGRMAAGIEILRQARSCLESSHSDTQKQVADAEAFVTRFTAGPCARSTPHIYISALPFCPKSSSVYGNYWKRTQGLVYANGNAIEHRSNATIAIWTTDSSIMSIAFSPDGTRIVSGSQDKTVRVWDAQSGNVVAGPFKGHTRSVNSVAFSPDGTRIVSGSWDKTIRVWDAQTGNAVAGPFEGHTSWVSSVAFSPDGKQIVSGSWDKTIRVWNAQTGDAVVGPFEGHANLVNSVAFSPDGTRIVSGSSDKTIRVWDAQTGNPIAGPFEGHTSWVNSVAFSPDGSQIVSGSWDKTIRVWDAQTGDAVAGPFKGHIDRVNSVAFSSDGIQIVSGSRDKTIRVWDVQTGNAVTGPFEGHTDLVNSVAFSPDSSRIISSSDDGTIRVWDAQNGDVVAGPFEGHTHSVNSVAFSPDGSRIVSGSWDKTVRVWDAQTGNAVAGPFKGHTSWVSSVAFSPDGTQIASGSHDKTIRVWDTQTGDPVAGPFEGHTNLVNSVGFSIDGTRIVSGSSDKTLRVWDAETGDAVAGPFEGHTNLINSVAFSPDGTRIVSGSWDRTIRVWDAQSGSTVSGPFEGHANLVNSVAFSPDGTQIVSGSSDNTVRVWNALTGNAVAGPFKGHTRWVNSVAFSPDGSQIVSGSSDKTIRVWDAQTGNAVTGLFEGHTSWVRSVAFSPDGGRIVSGSNDNTIRVWDAPTGKAASIVTNTPLDALNPPSNIRNIYFYVANSTFDKDGWLIAFGVRVLWVSPYFRQQMPDSRNTLVIGTRGSTYIDYRTLHIGNTWSRCLL